MKSESTEREYTICWRVLSISFVFMITVFAPLNIFLTNQSEFWFSLKQLVPVLLIAFVCMSFLLYVVGGLVGKFQRVARYFFVVLLCLYMFFYIQGNYIPRNYGVLDGQDINWNSYLGYGIASIILFFVIAVVGCLLMLKFQDKLYKVGKYVGFFVLMIQIVTIGTLYIQNNILVDDSTYIYNGVVTQKNMFSLSKDNNVIVFLLDTFDAADMNYLLENEDSDEYKELFDGFTYYPDTLGMYPTTKASLPYILTGVTYENEQPYVDYVQEAYTDNSIYTTLESAGYSSGVYTNRMYLSDNLGLYVNVLEGNYVISNYEDFASKLYKLVAFNYLPHQMKKYFYLDTSEFSTFRETKSGDKPYSTDVQNFYKKLSQEGIDVSLEGNCFRFYHLNGVHLTYTFGKDLISDDNVDYTVYDEAAGNCTLLEKYFNELKENGIYDKSTIIVMADHGHVGYSQNPVFLIKNADESHSLKVSDEKMSYEYLKDVFISLINGENVSEEYVSSCNSDTQYRRFYFYSWDDAWDRQYMPGMEEMYAIEEADDINNFVSTGNCFLAENADYTYTLGDKLEFVDGRSGYTYCKYGVSYGRFKKISLMQFELSGKHENVEVHMILDDSTGFGNMDIYANDKLVAELSYGEEKDVYFIIPAEYIEDDNLQILIRQTNDVENDIDKLKDSNLVISEMEMYDTDKEFSLDSQLMSYQYSLGTILLDGSDNVGLFVVSGLSYYEEWGRWTDGDTVELKFRVTEEVKEEIVLSMEYGTFDGEQSVVVSVNGTEIESYVANGDETKHIIIPVELIEDDMIKVTLKLPDAHSPESVGQGKDGRELALAMRRIMLSKKE